MTGPATGLGAVTTPAPGAVIELGEGHGVLAGYAPRGRAATRRPLPPWLRRWRLAGFALVLLLVYASGGAAPPAATPLRLVGHLAVADGSSVMVDGDLLMVLGDGQVVTAYSTRTGAPAWRTAVSLPVSASTMTASEGVVLVSRDEYNPGYDNSVAIDEASGRLLWHSRSAVFLPLSGTGTVLMQPATGSAIELAAVRSGVPRWTVGTEGCQFTLDRAEVPPQPHAFATVCPGGEINLVRLPTGERTVTRLPPGSDGRPSEALQVLTVGSVLLVERTDGGTSAAVEAYRWRDGGLAWSRGGFDRGDGVYPCAVEICVDRGDGRRSALDLDTGADVPAPSDGPVPCCRPTPRAPDPTGVTALLLVPSGRVAPPQSGSTVVVAAQPPAVGQYLQVYAAQFLHAVLTDPGGPTLVEVVDRDGRVRSLQVLPRVVPGACTAITAYLICPTAPGQVTVWRYPQS